MEAPFISICVPSYHSEKRPGNLYGLLKTIDAKNANDIEIIITDDKSPKIEIVRAEVQKFLSETKYRVVFKENAENLGYDRNIKELTTLAKGKWIVFMGDDDEFVSGALDKLIHFLRQHDELGFVLKSHYTIHAGNKPERFRYFDGTRFFEPGVDTLVTLFRRSVFIAGFTIRREFLPPLIDDFDHSLLVQNYFLGEVVLKHKAAYFDEPLVQQYEDGAEIGEGMDGGKKEHAVRSPSLQTSINFMKSYIVIPEYFDTKYGIQCAAAVKRDMSKYFYPSLALHRNKGLRVFFAYVRELNKLGFNITVYYYVYVIALTFLGRTVCDNIIRILKNVLGKTPQL